METATFFETYWEREFLHISANDPGRFTSLLSISEIDPLLVNYGRLQPLDIRLSKHENGQTRTVDVAAEQPYADVNRVLSAYSEGFTVNLNHLHERHGPARELAIALSDTLNCLVTVNGYLTPAGAQGFPLHFDSHDTLIVQIEGAKSWRVYAPNFPLPTKTHMPPQVIPGEAAGSPTASITLEAGAILYLPRGFGHAVSTADRTSLHLTVGFHGVTYLELLQTSLTLLGWDLPLLRRSVPPGVLASETQTATVRAQFETLRTIVSERLPLQEALAVLAAQALATRPAESADRFNEVRPDSMASLCPQSRVRKRQNTPCRVVEGCGWVSLHYPSHTVSASLAMGRALEFVARSEEFVISALPGHVTDDEKVALVRRLVGDGLLVPVLDRP